MPGAFALIFGLNAAAMGVLNNDFYPRNAVWAFAAGGLILDGLCLALAQARASTRAAVMAGVTPVALLGTYFLAVHFLFGGIAWRIHFWMGILALTALSGALMSALIPERNPDPR